MAALDARVYDIYENFLFEGKASYNRHEKTVQIRAETYYDMESEVCRVQYNDNQGLFDFNCSLLRYEMEDNQHLYVMEVEETVSVLQRRNDVKMKTNIAVKVTLLDDNNAIVIDPETRKAQQIPAFLRDISAGGVMLDMDCQVDAGQKLMFPFDKGSSPSCLRRK